MGQITGSGAQVFDNLILDRLTDEKLQSLGGLIRRVTVEED